MLIVNLNSKIVNPSKREQERELWQAGVGCETPDEMMAPFNVGVMDAEDSLLCIPSQYYTQLCQMREYAEGHESISGPTLLSGQILGRVASQAPLLADDLDDDMLDREFWARGGW
jgi:hypothetical protein